MAQGKKPSKARKTPQSGRKAKAAKAKKKTLQKGAVRRRKAKADVAGHVLGLMKPLGGGGRPGTLGLDRQGYTSTGTTGSSLSPFVGKVLSSQGLVCVERGKALTGVSPKGEGVPVMTGDTVTTFEESYAKVIFLSGGEVHINQNTVIKIVSSNEVKDVTSYTALQAMRTLICETWAKITKQQEEEEFETHGGVIGTKG